MVLQKDSELPKSSKSFLPDPRRSFILGKNRIYLIDKPAGVTSFQALGSIKKHCGTKKVGHAGTLDKFATGLLVVFTGWCTRLIPWFIGMDKSYSAIFRFGEETNTLDPEGIVVEKAGVPDVKSVATAFENFRGQIQQVPPIFSAVHAGGERAYKIALAGKTPDLKARTVTIHSLNLLSYSPPEANVAVRCSKGTYIRSLARDIGRACGSRAYVTTLRRDTIGEFCVSDAQAPDALSEEKCIDPVWALSKVAGIGSANLGGKDAARVQNGGTIDPSWLDLHDGQQGMLTAEDGSLLAIVEQSNGKPRYALVVPRTGNGAD